MRPSLRRLIDHFVQISDSGGGVMLTALPRGARVRPRCPLCGYEAICGLLPEDGAVLLQYQCRNAGCPNRGKMVTELVREEVVS